MNSELPFLTTKPGKATGTGTLGTVTVTPVQEPERPLLTPLCLKEPSTSEAPSHWTQTGKGSKETQRKTRPPAGDGAVSFLSTFIVYSGLLS